jgi:hypothetical protein
VQAIRGAYEGQDGWRDHVRKAAAIVTATGLALPGSPGIRCLRRARTGRPCWTGVLGPALERLIDEIRRRDDESA